MHFVYLIITKNKDKIISYVGYTNNLNNRILQKLKLILATSDIESGNVDISFYRDDIMRRDEPIVPQVMDMDLSVEAKKVVLIDDVVCTGRSIRSAIDAILTFGRPASIELLTLVNRRFSSYIYKYDNVYGDRTIRDYIRQRNGESNRQHQMRLIIESERIKKEILDFEQDMWNR